MQTPTRPIFQWPPYVIFLKTEQLISRPLWLASYKPISRHWSTISEKVWKTTFTTIHTDGDLKQILRCTVSAIPENNFKEFFLIIRSPGAKQTWKLKEVIFNIHFSKIQYNSHIVNEVPMGGFRVKLYTWITLEKAAHFSKSATCNKRFQNPEVSVAPTWSFLEAAISSMPIH